MKNRGLFTLIFVLTIRIASAQTIGISGTVKNSEGQPLHFAFVKDTQSKNAVYTDSTGSFNIQAASSSSLYINCFGYKDTTIAVNSRVNIGIVLRVAVIVSDSAAPNDGTGAVNANNQTIRTTLSDAITFNGGTQFAAAHGDILPQFNPKDETEGSRFFIKGWSHGYVITAKGSTVQNTAFFYSYDKMGGALLLTKNQVSAIEVNREIVKSFTIYNNADVPYTFENVPQIDGNHYVQVLASGDKYKIYKAIKTTFEKANYTSDGVMTHGHNYDLYADEDNYYVYDVKANTFQKILLKKKALKDAFAKDADKLNKYMSDNSGTIDETYLLNLGNFMNQ